MKLEILGKGSTPFDMVITVSFNCRKDMQQFRLVFDRLEALFPSDEPSTPCSVETEGGK